MSKPRLARLAQEAAKITFLFNRTLPEGVTRATVTSFLGILRDNPSDGDIKDYVGEPTANYDDEGNAERDEEINFFSEVDNLRGHQKVKYFYQRLAVAYFDKIIQQGDQKSQELISNMAASADYIGENGEHDSLSEVPITPMAMYLHAKFQDLKEGVRAVSNLSYNEFKGLARKALEDDN